jgi:hypothetical protein
MCYAPGIVAWAINGYKFKEDRDAILNVILAWDIPEQVAKDLLSEKVPYTVEDGTVVVEAAE